MPKDGKDTYPTRDSRIDHCLRIFQQRPSSSSDFTHIRPRARYNPSNIFVKNNSRCIRTLDNKLARQYQAVLTGYAKPSVLLRSVPRSPSVANISWTAALRRFKWIQIVFPALTSFSALLAHDKKPISVVWTSMP
jgi:hypothetical protein